MKVAKQSGRKAAGFRTKRIYDPAGTEDGLRVLVDRLWPRGIAKDKAHIDQWLKDVAPSDALRKRFHGHPEMWEDFVVAYGHELACEPAATDAAQLRAMAREQPITLLYAARDQAHNNAVALKALLERKSRPQRRPVKAPGKTSAAPAPARARQRKQ
jgi:uncharacterized protein YeaO (DUF488 family)